MNNYLKFTNYAGYTGKVLGSYMVMGKTINFETPDIYALQSFGINLQDGASNLNMVSFFYDTFAGYSTITRTIVPNITTDLCFYFYGTIFNPSFQQVPCNGVGGGNPDIPNYNQCCCCCCHCCNCCCPSGNNSCGNCLQW